MWLLGLCQEVCPEGTDMLPGPATQKLAPKAVRGSTSLWNDQISMTGGLRDLPESFLLSQVPERHGPACLPSQHSDLL